MALEGIALDALTGGGPTVATDRVGGQDYQVIKLAVGADGTANLVSNTDPIPISDAGAAITVDGTVELGPTALAALETITVAGITAALPAGNNNIGDVDVVSIVPGTGATALGKAEDAAHGSGDTGVMSLGVRRDANTSLVGTDGDYAPFQLDALGAVKVAITSGAGTGGTSLADAAAFTRGVSSVTPIAGMVETSAPTLTNGQVGAASLTTSGALRVSVAAGGIAGLAEDSVAAGGEDGVMVVAVRRDTATSGVSADGDFAALSVDSVGALRTTASSMIPGTGATNLGKAEDAAHTTGDTGVMMLGVRQDADTSPVSASGDYHAPIFDALGNLKVNIKAGAGAGGTASTDDAAFTAASGSGTPIMGFVTADTVDSGDVGVVAMTAARELKVSLASGGVAAATEDAVAAGGEEGVMMLGVRRDTPSSGVSADGDFCAPSFNSSGAMYVTGGGGGTQYAEDAVHASGDTGTLALVVRKDTAAQVAGTDGDYSTLVNDASGRLHVNVGAHTPGVAATNLGKAEDAVAGDGDTGVAMLAVRRDSAASGVSADGDYAMLSVDSTGALRTVGSSGTTQYTEDTVAAGGEALCLMGAIRRDTANSEVSAAGDYSPLLTDANGRLHVITALAAAQNLATIGTSIVPGTSATHLGKAEDAAHASGDTGVMSLAVRTDTAAAASGTTGDYEPFHTDSVGALWSRSTGEAADDSAFTPATSRVFPVGYFADEASTDSVDEGDVGAARMTLDRKTIVANYVHTAGGQTPYAFLSTAAVLAAVIKASPGTVYGLQFFNLNAGAMFVRLYNQTGSPATTDGANILWRGFIPGDTAGAGFTVNFGPQGIAFGTGIGIRVSGAVADNDATALSANTVTGNVQYA